MKTALNLMLMTPTEFTYERMSREIRFFNRLFPRIQVNFDIIPWTKAWDRIIQCINENRGPDIVQIGNSWTSSLGLLNAFKDITGLIGELDAGGISQPALKVCRKWNTRKYISVPWFLEIKMLYYRKDLIRKHGFDIASFDTIDKICDVCEYFRKNGHGDGVTSPFQLIHYRNPLYVHDLGPWIWNHGGDFFSPDGRTFTLDSENSIKGIMSYCRLIQSYMSRKIDLARYGRIDESFFMDKESVFSMHAIWPLYHFLGKKDCVFGVSQIPGGPVKRLSFFGGSNLAVMNYSEKTEEAFQFIKFLLTRESQVRYCTRHNGFPANINALNEILDGFPEYREILLGCYLNSKSLPVHPLWGSLEGIIADWIGSVVDAIMHNAYSDVYLVQEINKLKRQVQFIIDL
jgi:multiple sugar transport system substrate-binding protein